jgi:hypothetical protein
MFVHHVVTPETFAVRFVELLPEYLPGVDTGAFEATDRRRCWNKTLSAVLTVIGNELGGLQVAAQNPMMTLLKDQSSLMWQRDGAPVFAMTTGWGSRNELEASLEWLEAFKCPQKLFIYSCTKWQEAVLDQIRAVLFRYPYHLDGEQYLFMNLVGAENRVYLLVANLNRSGRSTSMDDIVLRPVPGSPLSWRTKPLRTASNNRG